MKKKLLLFVLVLCFLFQAVTFAHADTSFTIHFIDVGQADAAVILCDDEVLMIDG